MSAALAHEGDDSGSLSVIRRWRHIRLGFTLVTIALMLHVAEHAGRLAFAAPSAFAHHAPPEGYGATTAGGTGRPEYRVTSLADSGPGTLRDAIAGGYRRVVFDVGGAIALSSQLEVRGPFVTIDATTAPAPGITLTNYGLAIRGTSGAHDVIVRGLRVRGPGTRESNVDSSNDCLAISRGAYNVLIDHVSISGCLDGAIDIAGDSTNAGTPPTRDVTVQWSLLADTRKMMLIKYGTTRISLHHNLFVRGLVRFPAVSRENLPVDDGVTVDMRNNVVWDWAGGTGTIFNYGSQANVIANLYGNPNGATNDRRQALIVCKGDGVETPETYASCGKGARQARAFAHTAGNLSVDGVALDQAGNVAAPFPSASVTTTSASSAGLRVAAAAGAPPRDGQDSRYVALVQLPASTYAGASEQDGDDHAARTADLP